METLTVSNNTQLLRFEVALGGEFAFLEYRWYKGDIALMHTVVPAAMQGNGIASLLAKRALEWAKEEQLKIMVYCPFVSKYLKDHPEYAFLTDRQYHPGSG